MQVRATGTDAASRRDSASRRKARNAAFDRNVEMLAAREPTELVRGQRVDTVLQAENRADEPGDQGAEKRIKERLDYWRALFEQAQAQES